MNSFFFKLESKISRELSFVKENTAKIFAKRKDNALISNETLEMTVVSDQKVLMRTIISNDTLNSSLKG
jgi:hypothetical protein